MAEADKKPEETKAQKFTRLATSRTNKALDAISNIRGLTNTTNYEYTPDQAAKIMGALEAEMTKLAEAFKGKSEEATGFAL